MKLASYRASKGAGYGIVIGDGIVDLTRRIGTKYPDLRALLAAGGGGRCFQCSSHSLPY